MSSTWIGEDESRTRDQAKVYIIAIIVIHFVSQPQVPGQEMPPRPQEEKKQEQSKQTIRYNAPVALSSVHFRLNNSTIKVLLGRIPFKLWIRSPVVIDTLTHSYSHNTQCVFLFY